MDVLIQIAQLILSLSILVILHELGHFIPAKLFKTRVEKFYLFFDPYFSIFKKQIGETEYGLGWIPLGGYVKISGMVDESLDTAQLNKEPEPWEFRSKPAWQRLIIMLGGVTVNVLLAIVIYSMLILNHGEMTLPAANAKYGFVCDSMAKAIGLQTGDKILGYDHNRRFDDVLTPIIKRMILDNALSLQIERNGQAMDIAVPQNLYVSLVEKKGKMGFVELAYPAEIDSVFDESPLKGKAQKGDKIIAVNGTPIQYFREIGIELRKYKNQEIPIQLLRGNDTLSVQTKIPETAFLTITSPSPEKYFDLKKSDYNLLTCFPAGTAMAYETFKDYIKQFRLLFNPKMKGWTQLGSFVTITKLFPKMWDWTAFWSLTAFLSIMLAFINVLPIPALDGGHAMFTLIEIITGRKPSDKFLERAQMVGMLLLLTLMVYSLGNDIFRNFFH